MKRVRARIVVASVAMALTLPVWTSGLGAQATPARPTRVLIVLFDQMVPKYASQFNMPNFRALQGAGTSFKNAYLGYMASETVMAHNVITSGQLPKHMGWTDEAYRDAGNLLGAGAGEMHITGDLSLANYGTLINAENGGTGYPKLADYLHTAFPDKAFIVVGEKSYAVETATAATGDIAVRLSSRKSNVTSDYAVDASGSATGGCRNLYAALDPSTGLPVKGQWRYAFGKNVPSYLLEADANDPTLCGRYYINADKGLDYGTLGSYPAWLYPEEGNRFFPGTDHSAQAGHTGGDTWAADAAIEMIGREDWSGMFVTLGAIDKAGHIWGAQDDAAAFAGDCNDLDLDPAILGANQTHVRCAAENADVQLGKLLDAAAAKDASDGGETLVVLTADHGATYGKAFYGKATLKAGDSNWYYGPSVYDGGCPSACFLETVAYNAPSPALAPLLATGNVQFSYQSTAIETWLTDHSVAKMKTASKAMLKVPGVTAAYWHDGDRFQLFGTRSMTSSERSWWKEHAQEIVDTMAASNGPDVVGLLHDKTSYGVYGDHGGAQESVQRVPMVFWSPSLAFANTTGKPFHTYDIMPTILQLMDIPVTAPLDGVARPID
ncbi:MAG: hypothetical protein ABI572_11790 [Actinomycetota bacterium]